MQLFAEPPDKTNTTEDKKPYERRNLSTKRMVGLFSNSVMPLTKTRRRHLHFCEKSKSKFANAPRAQPHYCLLSVCCPIFARKLSVKKVPPKLKSFVRCFLNAIES